MTRGYPDFGHGYAVDDWIRQVPPGAFVGEVVLLALRTETAGGVAASLTVPFCSRLLIIIDCDTLTGVSPVLQVYLSVETSTGELEAIGSTGPILAPETYVFQCFYWAQVYTISWFIAGTNPSATFTVTAMLGH